MQIILKAHLRKKKNINLFVDTVYMKYQRLPPMNCYFINYPLLCLLLLLHHFTPLDLDLSFRYQKARLLIIFNE